jgi:hypothetical protein
MKRPLPGALSAALSVALLSACAGLPTAQVETPAELAASPVLALPAAHGRSGGFTLPDQPIFVSGSAIPTNQLTGFSDNFDRASGGAGTNYTQRAGSPSIRGSRR